MIYCRIKRLVSLGTRMLQKVCFVFYLRSFFSGSVIFFEFDLRITAYFYTLLIMFHFFFVRFFFFHFFFFIFLFCLLDDFLNDLLRTGVYGYTLPKRTCLIASIKADNGEGIFNKRFVNTPHKKHAEVEMIDDEDFLHVVADYHDIEIILTLNYSPCSSCAETLKTFNEKNGNIRNFIIQFSFLYCIKEEKNRSGLRNLSNAGITLQAMNANSWREVGIDLESMAFTDERRIRGRDKKTGDMLCGVLCTYQDEQDQDTPDDDEFAPCQVIRIPKSGKFLLVVYCIRNTGH